jgi:RHS repeat-associated protein
VYDLHGTGTWLADWKILPADYNGDGRSDLCASYTDSGGWRTHCALSQGDGTFTAAVYDLHGTGTWLADWKILPADYDGNGIVDICASFSDSGGWRTHCVPSNNEPPFLLTSVSNGLGATTTIEYTPSTEYTNTQLPFPVQTVSKITTNDGNGNVASTTYEYDGGFHHIGERDFRGFHHVKVTGPAGPSGEQTISETWFHQGNDTAVDVNNPNVPDGYLKGAPYRTKVTDGLGNLFTETTTTYVADSDGVAPFFTPPASVVTAICDGNGCGKQTRTDFTYDTYGNVTEEYQYGDTGTSTDDRTVVRTFTPNTTDWLLSLPTSETIYAGLGTGGAQMAQTDFYYDGTTSCAVASTNQLPTQGNLTRVTRWLSGGTSPETRMAYDSMGNVTCTRDANGNTTTMAYDASGTFATSVTNPLGHVTSTTYYGVNGVAMDLGLYGQVKTVTDPNGAVVTSEYDALGRRTTVTQPDGFWTTTSYVSFGTVGTQHVKTDSQLGLSTWSYFDGLGRTITSKTTGTDSKIIVTETEYDVRGAVTRSSTPYFETGGTPLWSTSIYDAMGRVVQATAPDGTRGLSCHDDWVSVSIDANDHKKRTTRDAYGRVAKVEEYTGTFTTCSTAVGTPYATTTYAYDVLGNLKTLTDAKGNQSTMVYDTLSRKTSMHDPDMGDWTYQYDANGNLTLQTDAKTQQIHFQYDALNRRVQKDYGTQKTLGSGDVVYTYDGTTNNRKGRLQQVDDASGTTTFYYDITGRVTKTDKVVDSITYTTQSAYDGLGRVTSLTYPNSSTVTQTYNGPQLQSVQEGTTTYASYSGFNALGQPSTLTLGNGVVTDYTYDAQNFRLKTLKTEKGTTVLQDLGYTFDSGGNVTTLTDTVHGTQTFNYDDLDRLTSATGGYGTVTYSYNEIGNMLSKSNVGTYAYPTSGSSSVRPHAVSSDGTNTYTYDANGNMILGAGRIITYDYENRPDSVIKNGVTTTFVYDGDGGRVKKSDGTNTTIYIGKLYVCEGTTPPLSCVKFIFSGGQRIAIKQVSSGSTSYFHADHLGSTSVLTDANGVAEEHNAYLPYGDTHTHTGTSDVAYKYTGKERDTTTGLYFYEARYYDPVLGRFISPDTLVQNMQDPQALNRYSYARNNPIVYNDPSGHFFGSIFKAITKAFKSISKGINRVLGDAAPFVMTAVAVVSAVTVASSVAFAAKSAFFKAATIGLTKQAAIGAKIVALSPTAGFVGGVAGGAAGGFVGGFVGSGFNFESGARSALTGGIFGGLGVLTNGFNPIVRSGIFGVAGGTISRARGGSFLAGFQSAGLSRLVGESFEYAKSETIRLGIGRGVTQRGPLGELWTFGDAACSPDCGAPPLAEENSKRHWLLNLFGDPGLAFANKISKHHDWVRQVFGAYTPEGFQNTNMNPVVDQLSNFPTMPLSLGITAVAADGGVLTLDYAVQRSGGR